MLLGAGVPPPVYGPYCNPHYSSISRPGDGYWTRPRETPDDCRLRSGPWNEQPRSVRRDRGNWRAALQSGGTVSVNRLRASKEARSRDLRIFRSTLSRKVRDDVSLIEATDRPRADQFRPPFSTRVRASDAQPGLTFSKNRRGSRTSHATSTLRLHADRASGRDRDHRRPDRAPVTRRAGRPRGGPAAQCTNNLKQLGLSIANYESANNTLPSGVVFGTNNGFCSGFGFSNNCQNTPWFVLMLSYIDQAPLYNAFNAQIGTEGVSYLGFLVNSTVETTQINSFQCPSDIQNYFSMAYLAQIAGVSGIGWNITKGNYGVNWGNTDFGQGVPGIDPFFPFTLYLQSPFGISRTGNGPAVIRMASITDGTSNTQFCSELLQGAPGRHAGDDLGLESRHMQLYDKVHSQRPPGLCPAVPDLCDPGLSQRAYRGQYGQLADVRRVFGRLEPRGSAMPLRQPTGYEPRVLLPGEPRGRVRRHAKPAPGRGEHSVRRRVGALHEELDQPDDVGCYRIDKRRRGAQLRPVLRHVVKARSSWGRDSSRAPAFGTGPNLATLARREFRNMPRRNHFDCRSNLRSLAPPRLISSLIVL